VLLFNLGGPEKLDDVRPFLYRLFSDPDIIRIRSALLRNTLAWLIATTRQSKSRALYRQIGDGSPLRKITEAQASALAEELARRAMPARVYVGMRCWKPFIDEAAELMLRDRIRRVIALPLFPQYSVTTTGSCFHYFEDVAKRTGLAAAAEIRYVKEWYSEPLYIESMAELIQQQILMFSGRENVRILYSAHSIPARYVDEGDPYLEQTKSTAALIDAQLGNVLPSTLAFQSKIGPVRWLGPSTKETIEAMGKTGLHGLLTVPVSFVSDHIETLQEMDILYKQVAVDSGIREYRRAASLNLHPKFIQSLAAIVSRYYR
jgi:protoporphyrin/coproporphyrin ferrochelatase